MKGVHVEYGVTGYRGGSPLTNMVIHVKNEREAEQEAPAYRGGVPLTPEQEGRIKEVVLKLYELGRKIALHPSERHLALKLEGGTALYWEPNDPYNPPHWQRYYGSRGAVVVSYEQVVAELAAWLADKKRKRQAVGMEGIRILIKEGLL